MHLSGGTGLHTHHDEVRYSDQGLGLQSFYIHYVVLDGNTSKNNSALLKLGSYFQNVITAYSLN